MRRLLNQLTIIFITLILCSCDRKVCPAYQSTFLIGKGDAEEYFSYFSPYDSLPKDAGIFRAQKKTKNGLVKKKFWPSLWTALSRSEYENRYNFPKAISTKNYVPDTTGMGTEEDLLAKEDNKKGKKRKGRKKDKEAETDTESTSIMDEGNIEEDLANDTNTVTPIADESTGEIVSDSLATDSTEVILKFTDQIIYELRFGDPTEKIESDSTSTEEEEEEGKRGLFGKKKKKKKDKNKKSIFNSKNKKKNSDATKEDEEENSDN